MENMFMKFVNENKWLVVSFLVWTFLHVIFLFNGDDSSGFWPFGDVGLWDYGWLECFVYEALPLLIFVIVKLVGKDIKKKIDDIKKIHNQHNQAIGGYINKKINVTQEPLKLNELKEKEVLSEKEDDSFIAILIIVLLIACAVYALLSETHIVD